MRPGLSRKKAPREPAGNARSTSKLRDWHDAASVARRPLVEDEIIIVL